MRLDPIDARIAYGVGLMLVILLLPGGVSGSRASGADRVSDHGGANAPAVGRFDLRRARMAVLDFTGLSKSPSAASTRSTACDIDIDDEPVVGVVGPNGSGKTTLFNVVAGALKPTGRARALARAKTSAAGRRTVSRGAVLCAAFSRRCRFPPCRCARTFAIAAEHGRPPRRGASAVRLAARLLALRRPGGLEGRDRGSLRSAICAVSGLRSRSAAQPKLLLLDEPAAGLNDSETEALASRAGSSRRAASASA